MPAQPATPRRVILFSGHMTDAPDRAVPRFPPVLEAAAAQRIGAALDALGAGPADLALTEGAAGGDLLFAEAAQARGLELRLLLPFGVDEFIARSVLPSAGGARWRERFYAVCARLAAPPQIMADECGPLPAGADPFARCNRWLLDTALAAGGGCPVFICLWDGGGGDGPGGTAHMVAEVQRRGGEVIRIDPRTL